MAYRKLSHLEHIRERPDTYVGSVAPEEKTLWVHDAEAGRVVQRSLWMSPGLYKCVDELVVNAIDQAVVDPTLDCIRIDVHADDNRIVVSNNGKGMPVVPHPEHNVYVPELVFGHLLTSSNYDDSGERIVGGRNGYGAKLANVFSKEFKLTVADPERKLKYVQTFRDNMTKIDPPKITEIKGAPRGLVSIAYVPDLGAFGIEKLDEGFVSLLRRRAVDASAWTRKEVKVYFDGKRISSKGLEDYVDLFVGGKKDAPRALDVADERWKVCVTASDSGFSSVSFVNGVYTPLGGSHVEHVAGQICRRVSELLTSKAKGLTVKPAQVREHIMLFVMATIPNPTFSSQTKEACNVRIGKDTYVVPDAFIEKVASKIGIADAIMAQARLREAKTLNKTDGVKSANLRGIPNLEDAINAGTSRSQGCTLILTEGLSARTFAISGLSVLGRDNWGVFPLKGKLLNLRNASPKQAANNAEFGFIKRIMGLKQETRYESLKQLRYGRIMILADADVDGIHIRGLCMNLIEHFWPELMGLGLCCTLKTPIVKAKRRGETLSFFTLKEFAEFRAKVGGAIGGYTCKYYKGLGTSTPQEAKEIFKSMDIVEYARDERMHASMELAFGGNADARKDWIVNTTRRMPEEVSGSRVTVTDFVNRELVQFSIADVKRSIPSAIDGLKPSQRKVVYACFKKGLTSDIKVAQLTGYASEVSHYVHGEASLSSTIVNLAQNYCGSNNANLLEPVGQFGSRLQGGKDAASARYISTRLTKLAYALFPESDFELLDRVDDDGEKVEPVRYVPVLPLLLLNGAEGIGTGFSTYVPMYDPREVAAAVRDFLASKEPRDLVPWFRGFRGEVEVAEDGRSFVTRGVFKRTGDLRIEVSELPVGTWTDTFKDLLEDEKAQVESFQNRSTETEVKFAIRFKESARPVVEDDESLAKHLKLASKKSLTNMHLFDADGVIRRFEGPRQILEHFFGVRLALYGARKEALERKAAAELEDAEARLGFVSGVVGGKIRVLGASDAEVEADLESAGIAGTYRKRLLDMPVRSLTSAKVRALEKEVAAIGQKRDRIFATTKEEMWASDLDALEALF